MKDHSEADATFGTVGELIAFLQTLPPEADCHNTHGEEIDIEVILTRQGVFVTFY